jgi:hypothetical protein
MAQLPTRILRKWSELREVFASRGNLLLGIREGEEWYTFVGEEEAQTLNANLHRYLAKGDPGWAPKGKEHLPGDWRGFMLPVGEIDRLGIASLRNELALLTALKNDFNWKKYFADLAKVAGREPRLPLVAPGLWNFVLQYADMLNVAHREGRGIGPLLRTLPAVITFKELLPSEQGLELLLLLCRRAYANHWRGDAFERLLGMAHAEVRAFIGPNRMLLERALANGRSSGAGPLAEGFYACCAADAELVALQELLDDAGGMQFHLSLPLRLRERFAPSHQDSLAGRVKSFTGKFDLVGALRRSTSSAPAAAPDYTAPFEPLVGKGQKRWSSLTEDDKKLLLDTVENEWPEDLRLELAAAASRRRNAHLGQIASYLMAPVLSWEEAEDRLLPAWKLPTGRVAEKAAEVYAEELKFAAEELAALDRALPRIARIKTLAALIRFEENMPFQRTPLAATRWRKALRKHREDLRNRGGYRTQRMREFGIDGADESEFRRNLWLDEMLKIEAEVRPFMAYVRKAFSAALPVGTTIEFDPYRHRHDGVEFDPETVQDQDKWLRGDVMKTLRGRKDFAHICQVNTFCLDYSRSMTHELMRDLFKVVFILVMGLEGRKSYDAIHFFGSDFYEVINFDERGKYTNRSVLFRVLRNISEIHVNRIIYSGVGGTNISAGVRKSHEKLTAFAGKLREEQPDLKFVSSLFVLTDGQPTMGITDLDDLNTFIEQKRQEGNVSIKGIFLKHEDDASDMITRIFGKEHAVESSTFKQTVTTFVQIMGRTYRAQRQDFRAAEKRRRLLGK